MKKSIIIIIVLLIIGLGIYYIISINKNLNLKGSVNNQELNTQDTALPKTNQKTAPSDMTIAIKDLSFIPAALTIKPGTKVTWVNNDTIPHTVTSDTLNLFDSGTLSPGQSFSYTFMNSGSFGYHCNIHKMMKGTVVVVVEK